MNNDIHLNNPGVDTTLTETTDLMDESEWSPTNSSLQSPYIDDEYSVGNPEVKQEDVDDSSAYQSVDERCTTSSNEVTLLFVVI